jgi:hypothetical protein
VSVVLVPDALLDAVEIFPAAPLVSPSLTEPTTPWHDIAASAPPSASAARVRSLGVLDEIVSKCGSLSSCPTLAVLSVEFGLHPMHALTYRLIFSRGARSCPSESALTT